MSSESMWVRERRQGELYKYAKDGLLGVGAEKVKDLVQKEFRLDRVIEKVEEMYNEAVNTK